MKNATKGRILMISALFIDISVPLIATVTQFPVWIEKSAEATVSGAFLILSVICIIPLFKQIKEYMKSPAVPIIWWVAFLLLLMLSNIIDQIVFICLLGGIANTVGMGIYKIGQYISTRPDNKKENDGEV